MPSVMIIGASRGIGLGFVQAYAAADGWQVHATTRTIDTPGELGAVPGDVTLYELDVIDAGQIHIVGGEQALIMHIVNRENACRILERG